MPLQHPFSWLLTHFGKRLIQIMNDPSLVDGHVTHRRLMIETGIRIQSGVETNLGLPQFLILHLQFNLMNSELMFQLLFGQLVKILQPFVDLVFSFVSQLLQVALIVM